MIRKADYPINEIFLRRWSPRAFTGESITDEQMMILFEAARWAPSSYNGQPWRFIYAKRETAAWKKLFDLMVPQNQEWAKNAALLMVIISHKIFDYNEKSDRTHSFVTGSAWENLALQATFMDLAAHGMEGFDYARAKKDLHIPDDYTVEAMAAVGKPGSIEQLSLEMQKNETPSDRKKIDELIFEGLFSAKN